MSAQRPDSPLIRPGNPFERRSAAATAQAKPNLSNSGVRSRALPGGTALETERRIGGGASVPPVWTIRSDLTIVPGLVGGKMPRIDGVALNALNKPTLDDAIAGGIPDTGVVYCYFKLNFTVSMPDGFLASYTLDTVDVELSTVAAPEEDTDTKYLLWNTITNGVWTTSYFNTSIPITLWDNGYDATLLRYGNL